MLFRCRSHPRNNDYFWSNNHAFGNTFNKSRSLYKAAGQAVLLKVNGATDEGIRQQGRARDNKRDSAHARPFRQPALLRIKQPNQLYFEQ